MIRNNISVEYDASSIKVLKGLKAVRRRPSMYIGDTGKRGLHHLIFEVVDNSIDEALAGFCSEIIVKLSIKDRKVTVVDNGRGIPAGKHKSGKSALEVVMTQLHAGAKFEHKAYQVSGGLHGVGVSVVNALSEYLRVVVYNLGNKFIQKYRRGKAITEVVKEKSDDKKRTGTVVTFIPDKEIFGDTEFEKPIVKDRLREIAYLNPGLQVGFEDMDSGKKIHYSFRGGISDLLTELSGENKFIHDIVRCKGKVGGVRIDVAFAYTDGFGQIILRSYVNDIPTIEGGSHVVGFYGGIVKTLKELGKSNEKKKKKEEFKLEDCRQGLVAVISVKIPDPQFEGQTKTKLGNEEVTGIVRRVVVNHFEDALKDSDVAQAILSKIDASAKEREAAEKARALVRKKSALKKYVLPGKLADCSMERTEFCELFLVEGDSAGGTAKSARDRRFQAILPLRGKVLNVEKAKMSRAFDNEEIKAMISAVGTGVGPEDFDISKLRYGKVVIMTDADIDGSHIRTLLLTFFYRYMRPLVEKGHLFAAMPPLYMIRIGKEKWYSYSEEEFERISTTLNMDNAHVQRYKGLGEMNSEQLWETTLDPAKRSLKQIIVGETKDADEMLRILMGHDVESRREFIIENALRARLDI